MEATEFPRLELPEDCLERVVKSVVDERDFESLSLVCRRFLTVTNCIRSRMRITDRTALVHGEIGILRLFCRFPNLKRIDLHGYQGKLDPMLGLISRSGLRLEYLGMASDSQWFPRSAMQELGKSMGGSLKVLDLSGFVFLNDEDLIAAAEVFPELEEIDVSYCYFADSGPYRLVEPELSGTVTDEGIVKISLKLKKLQRINLSGNHFVSDRSLVALSSNCPMLSKIVACESSFLRGEGIAFVLSHSPNLKELLVEGIRMDTYSSIEKNLGWDFARALHCIRFSEMSISHELLVSLAEAVIPLKELALCHCWNLSFVGIYLVLQGYRQTLCRLDLVGISFLTDGGMSSLIPHLGALNSINLSSCMQLSNLTLFELMKSCLHLEEIKMSGTCIGRGGWLTDLWRNSRIRSLVLENNRCLDDQTLEHIGWMCPKLNYLCISNCWAVSERGIRLIGENCTEIRELQAMGIQGVKGLGIGLGFLKLEVLKLSGSGIEDEGLSMIAQRCKELVNLELEGCYRITEGGVKKVVSNCKRLRVLNLGKCYSVNLDLAWMSEVLPWRRQSQDNAATATCPPPLAPELNCIDLKLAPIDVPM